MKKVTAITAALVAGASFATADELSVSATFAWESEYIFRGVALAEDTFMPSVDLSYGAFYAGIWAALPVDTVYGNEVDLYAGYGFDVSETVGLDFGATYYTYPDAQDDFFDSDVNTFEFYAGVNFATPFSPSVYAFYDIDLEAFTLELAGGHSFELSDSSAIDLSVYLGHVEPDEGMDYQYYGAGVSYGYSFTDNAGASFFVNWYGSSEDTMMGGDDNELTFGWSFSAGF